MYKFKSIILITFLILALIVGALAVAAADDFTAYLPLAMKAGEPPQSTATATSEIPVTPGTPTATRTATITKTPGTPVTPGAAIIIDHQADDISQIPAEWLAAAKEHVAWVYGSTSHGQQIWQGTSYWHRQNSSLYNFLMTWPIPEQQNPLALRFAVPGDWAWGGEEDFLSYARENLNAEHSSEAGQVRAFAWSWCGEVSYDDQAVTEYLSAMYQLETEYPDVTFVYMTGHTDGSGPGDSLAVNNERIRQQVHTNDHANGRVLFDFADLESWSPDDIAYESPSDGCPGCEAWCAEAGHEAYCENLPLNSDLNPGAEFPCSHSHGLNCKMKGQAFWWLSAILAGWDGVPTR